MKKPRNPQAVAAWSRHGGAHNPGSKRPARDERDAIDEALEEAAEAAVGLLIEGGIEIDGEWYEIEFVLDEEGEDDDEETN